MLTAVSLINKLFFYVASIMWKVNPSPQAPDLIRNYDYRGLDTVLHGIVSTVLLCYLTFQRNRL